VQSVERLARSSANRRIAFFGHLAIWGAVCLLLLVAAPFFAAVVVALSWGVGLVAHGFFGVLAPMLRARWVDDEVGRQLHQSVTHERRALEGRHARALEQLSASVAHEIRNPITAAKSLVQQIAEDPACPENAEYARVAAAELDRVERAVSHLLRYAREEPVTLGDVEVEPLIDSALESVRDRLKTQAVRIERDASGAGWLYADADKLRRVLVNLIENALDALDESSFPDPCIRISTGTSLAGNEVWIRVADNGPGIEPDSLPKVFDPFHTGKPGGTGIGLAITRKLVEAHGGHIEVESKLGAGTELVMTFPRHGPES
jgi:two-component system sensor histidine kinase PilS (NtrC family)